MIGLVAMYLVSTDHITVCFMPTVYMNVTGTTLGGQLT
jgi:hypothetical protein